MYIIYLIIFVFSFIYLHIKFNNNSNRIIIFIWFVAYIYIGVYAYFTDDYDAYADVVTEAYINPLGVFSIEPFWIWLANFTYGNIDLYRFVVFGTIIILLFLIKKISHAEMKYLIIYYTLFCMMFQISGIRQALNMILCLYGILLCIKKQKIAGFLCIIFSCFLHKSGIMYACIIFFCLLQVSKRTFLICLVILPILHFISKVALNTSTSFLPLLALQHYAEHEGEFSGRHIIVQLLNKLSELCIFFSGIFTVFLFNKSNDRLIMLLTRCLYGLLFFTVLLFLLPIDTNVVYKRLLWFGMLIMIVIWSKGIQDNLMTRKYILLFLLFILQTGASIILMISNNYWQIEKLTRLP